MNSASFFIFEVGIASSHLRVRPFGEDCVNVMAQNNSKIYFCQHTTRSWRFSKVFWRFLHDSPAVNPAKSRSNLMRQFATAVLVVLFFAALSMSSSPTRRRSAGVSGFRCLLQLNP